MGTNISRDIGLRDTGLDDTEFLEEEDLYTEQGAEQLLDDDVLKDDEEAFMYGYLRGLPEDFEKRDEFWLDEEEEW